MDVIIRNLKIGLDNVNRYKNNMDNSLYNEIMETVLEEDKTITVESFQSFEHYKLFWYFDIFLPELKKMISQINDHLGIAETQNNIDTLPPQQNDKPKPELTISQIALKYVYLGKQITRENGNEIAKKYGHNSGEKLFQRFTYFSSPTNRKGKPNLCTPKKLDNKIKLIESIIELLPTDKQERAKDEVSMLKKIYEAEYQ